MNRLITFLAAVCAAVLINLQGLPLMAQGSVTIDNISVSPFGSSPGFLSGKVTGINPATVRVTLLDFISGLGFFTKPLCSQTTTALNADGTFSILTTTGGVDQTTTLYAVVVVPASATVPCYGSPPPPGVPLELQQQALAIKYVDRPNPGQRQIQFAGETWFVKANSVPLSPGPNYFSDSQGNVWVDGSGKLHLRITHRNGQWYCAEIYSRRLVGYGQYQFQVDTSPNIDRNVTVGFFTYADGENDTTEIDALEIGRWGDGNDPNNVQNVVQPFATPGNLLRFVLPEVGPSVNSMTWQPNGVSFRSANAQGTTLHEWTYGGQPPVPRSARLSFRMNLWLVAPPSDGQEAEVVISQFSYTAGPLQFVPLAPCRVMDTRNPNAPLGGPFIAGGSSRTIPMAGACGIPSMAAAYSINATVIPRTASLGYITLWPTGASQPLASTLNSPGGLALANAAIVPAGVNGSIDVYATDDTNLVIDANGYFIPPGNNALQFFPLPPCRVLDTRNANGTFGGPFLYGSTSRSFPIPSSACGVPSSVAAYSLNVTAVPHGPLGYLTAWPSGSSQPLVSTLNSLDGTVLANAAILPAGTGGAVNFFAANETDLVVDINGYFATPATGGLNFYAKTPCRLVDTRFANGVFGSPGLVGGTIRTFPIPSGSCGVPSTSAAYSFNVTAVPSGLLGYLTIWPTGQPQPGVSTLNAIKGQVVANAAIVPAGLSGSVDVFVTNNTDMVVDVNGYFGQ